MKERTCQAKITLRDPNKLPPNKFSIPCGKAVIAPTGFPICQYHKKIELNRDIKAAHRMISRTSTPRPEGIRMLKVLRDQLEALG